MITVIRRGSDKAQSNKKLEKALKSKGVDTHKFCGVIKLNADPVDIQKRMRNEC